MKRSLGLAAAIVSGAIAVTVGAPAAHAGDLATTAVDDGFGVETTDGGCGYGEYVDYGEGKPGHGPNDDYIRFSDECADGWDVRARVWVNDVYQGQKFNTGGWNSETIWDPFPNVRAGDVVELQICLYDQVAAYCGIQGDVSTDG